MKNKLFFIVLVITIFGSDYIMGNEKKFVKADIFYYGWDVLTRKRLEIGTVRSNYRIHIVLVEESEVTSFVHWLKLDEMKRVKDPVGEDPRLVIDLYENNGAVTTFFASNFNLCSSDLLYKYPIDEEFKRKFHF